MGNEDLIEELEPGTLAWLKKQARNDEIKLKQHILTLLGPGNISDWAAGVLAEEFAADYYRQNMMESALVARDKRIKELELNINPPGLG